MPLTEINPITKCDYPDPDVIRVGDVYYMASTTMYFSPGGAILRSYDLVNWEIASYLFDVLDDIPEERLENERTNYAGGMWAPTLRYHDGKFYCAFVSHFTQTTYLFVSDNVEGPWEKRKIEGYYHDCSLLFDDDDRVYIVYGNKEIYLTELKKDLTGPLPGGVNKLIVKEPEGFEGLGYEGSHFYKINGKYYIFFIHWPKGMMRTEAVFVSDKVDGEYKGKNVFSDDRGLTGQGVAQGGIVDTPNGKWYAMLFQDSGAVGRIPILVPMTWEDDFPVFGVNGKVPKNFNVAGSRPYYRYEPLYTSDDFKPVPGVPYKLKPQWEWNHCPDNSLWEVKEEGGLVLRTGSISSNLTMARNTLTQRMMWPRCEAEVTVDASKLKEGDVAGLCALQGEYAFLGITMNAGVYYLMKVEHINEDPTFKIGTSGGDYLPGKMVEKIRLTEPKLTLCLKPSFENMADKLDFFYLKDGRMVKVGNPHKLYFRLDHFTGCRFGLFMFSTREAGGEAVFTDFKYHYEQ